RPWNSLATVRVLAGAQMSSNSNSARPVAASHLLVPNSVVRGLSALDRRGSALRRSASVWDLQSQGRGAFFRVQFFANWPARWAWIRRVSRCLSRLCRSLVLIPSISQANHFPTWLLFRIWSVRKNCRPGPFAQADLRRQVFSNQQCRRSLVPTWL